jgi:spore coat polysaccharide biosynthesis protein SpsF
MSGGALALVAVRLKSQRLPGKALLDLAGEPLIWRLHERIRQSRHLSGIIWCTSTEPGDGRLADLARARGVDCHRGSPLDVMGRFLEASAGQREHTLVRITGDNPLTDPALLDAMLEAHWQAGAEYTGNRLSPRGTRAEVVERAALKRCHALLEHPESSEYMTLMLRRPDHFRVAWLEAVDSRLRRPELRLTVDTPEDYAVLRAIYEAFQGRPPELAEIISWLDANRAVRDANAAIQERTLDAGINVRLRGDA